MLTVGNIVGGLKRKEVHAFLVALFCSFLVFPIFFDAGIYPVDFSGPSWLTLDPSWQLALSKVNIDKLNWGKDFAFTYGPLSFLSTRVGWGVNKFSFLVFDLFLAFNFFYIFYFSLVKSGNRTLSAVVIISSCILLPRYFGSGNALILLFFLVFWIRQSFEKNQLWYYLMQVVIVVLLFFIKFNTGLISFVLFSLGLLYKFFFTSEKRIFFSGYFLLAILLIAVLCKQLNVSFWDYLMGGMNMVSGYNEIMYLDQPFPNEFRFSVAIILLGVYFLIKRMYLQKLDLPRNLAIFVLFAIPVFVLYKQAFVRGDIQHIQEFYKYVLLLIVCLQDFHFERTHGNGNLILVTIVFLSIFYAKKRDEHLFNFEQRLSKAVYIEAFKDFTDTSGLRYFQTPNLVPQQIKDKLGQSGIDAYPWNSHVLFENRLNYTPRPVFQSYTAYTPYLENLNFGFYNSKKAPRFVFYEFDAIDDRYALFDEPKLNLCLLKNYTCIDTFRFGRGPILVLERKNAGVKEIKFEKIREYEMSINEQLVPKQDVYYELFVSNSFSGKIISTLKYAPEINLLVKTRDGNIREFRTSKKLLESGIFGKQLFNSTMEFYHFMKGDTVIAEKEILAYGFRPKSPGLFNEIIKVVEYKIN